jgi:hypothetical protein
MMGKAEKSEGLWGALIDRYGRKPSQSVLIAVLKNHSVEVDEEASEEDDKHIVVIDAYFLPKERRNVREVRTIPSNLKSVMEFLGY